MKNNGKTPQKKNPGCRGAPGARRTDPGRSARGSSAAVGSTQPAGIEARFQAVFESSRDAIGISKDGVQVFVNPAYLDLFGFPPGTDLAGKPVLDLVAPESRDQIGEYIRRRERGESAPSAYETRGLRADGSAFDLAVNASSYQENGEEHTLAILRDITRRKMAEEEVSERGAMLQQIMDTASVTIFLVDRSGRIVHANRRMAEMFGRTLEELVGCEYVELVHPSERETGQDKMLALLTGDIPSVDLERLYLRKDGTQFWGHLAGRRFHDVHGKELGLIGVVSDISLRKQSDEALKESEQKYKLLIEATNTGYVIIDEAGRVLDANEEYVHMTGRGRLEDVLGRPVTDWTAAYDLERNAAEVRQCMESGSVRNLVVDYVDEQGKTITVEMNATMLPGPSSARIFTICRDITERRKLEEQLRASEERILRTFEDSPVGVAIVTPDMHFQSVNKRLCEIIGYQEHELVGRHFASITHPDDVEEGVSKTRRTLAGEIDHFHQEKRYLRKDGTPVWARTSVRLIRDGKGDPQYFLTVIEDITAQMLSGLALKKSEVKYRRLYNDTPILLHSIDRNGIVVDVNDYWLKTMGYKRAEVIGRKVSDFYTDASRKYSEEAVQPAFFREGGAVRDIVYQFIKKNGEVLDVLLSATAERDSAGNVVRSQAVITDITQRKRMEEELQKSERMLQTIIDTEPDCIKVIDEESRLIMMNRAGLNMIQADSLDEVKGQFVCPLVTPEYQQAFMDLTRRVFQGGSGILEFRMAGMRGSQLWLETHAVPLRNEKDEIIALLGVTRDISERKRVEQEMREKEDKYRELFESANDGIFIQNAMGFADCNQRGAEMYGLPKEKIIGRSPAEFAPERQPDGRLSSEVAKEKIQAALNGFPQVFEWQPVRADGSPFDVEITLSRLVLGGALCLQAIVRDITERKRAEEKINTYSAGLQRLLSISREMTATTDTASLYRIAIQTAVDLLHFDFSTIMVLSDDRSMLTIMDSIGFPSSMVGHFHLVEGQGLATYAAKNMRPEAVVDFRTETRFAVPAVVQDLNILSALCVPMMLEDRVFGVLIGHTLAQREFSREDTAIYQSIGNQAAIAIKNAMNLQAMRENQERLDLALQSAHMGVWRWEIKENRRYFDELTYQVLGIDPATFTGTADDLYRAVHPEDREKLKAALARSLEQDVPYEPSYRAVWGDGSIHYITSRGRLFRDDKGQPARVNGILWDVTDQHLIELELIKNQKLESIGTLAGGIAHDFNNLLQGVFGYISMAKLTFDQKEKSLAMLAQAEKALHQSVNLTSQLLTFSKGGKPLKRVIDLRPVIENSVSFALSGSHNTYEMMIDDGLRAVEADEGQIGQVIQNILLNADQSMPLGGRIRVSVRNRKAASVTPQVDLQGDLVEISIRDQGTGIPAEHLTRIFDPYFTTKEKGSGLGLATSYSIIKNHGGLVRVQSEVGKGTTFVIYLEASGSVEEGPKDPAIPKATRKGRILVMDDEELIRMVAGEILSTIGHDAAFAETGEAAIEAYRSAREEGRAFDVVILDLTIRGGMGGMETLRKLKEIDPFVKAVVSSGYSDDASLSNYRQQGFRSFLKKPYNIEELQGTLNALLA